jgi:serine/threonine protein kinase
MSQTVQRSLVGAHNCFPAQWVHESDRAGYIVRQAFYLSLYDRITTRPFLSTLEKRWLAYQLLAAVAECHARGVCHGDIKLENVLVTTWSWLYLTDFATPYKVRHAVLREKGGETGSGRRTHTFVCVLRASIRGCSNEAHVTCTWEGPPADVPA